MNPLLYLGYKFDFRVWMLVKKSKKEGLEVYIYRKGYARIAGQKFVLGSSEAEVGEESPNKKGKKANNSNLNNLFIHLTNNAVQKNSKEYG